MSALDNQNNSNTNNYEDKVREESKSVGVAEVELGLSQGQGGASNCNESQRADPEETIVATQLDGIVAVEEEDGGSSSSTSGFLRESGVHPTPDERAQKLAAAVRGGIHQSNKPSWPFRGKLSMTYGNRKADKDPAVKADKDTQRAETCGYYTTVEPWVEGEQLSREMLNLIRGEGESVAVFREQILNKPEPAVLSSGLWSSTSGSLREQGVFPTPDERAKELAAAMRRGIHQSSKPT